MKKVFTIFALVAMGIFICFAPPSGPTEEGMDRGPSPASSDRPSPGPPNIVFVLTDDLAEDDLKRLPGIGRIMGDAGTTFENAYVTYPLCCPSRASILRGQYPHNHRILGNISPLGGADKFRDLGRDRSTVATWLDGAGYRTAYIGKYLNGYDEMYEPPGWDEWFAVLGEQEDRRYNDDGIVFEGGGHSTDLFSSRTTAFVRRASKSEEPFFAFVATTAPHYPPEIAKRYRGRLARIPLPKPPSFDEAHMGDKPRWIRGRERLTDTDVSQMAQLHRRRLASMLSVVDLLQETIDTLRETGELDDTYVFFASDNGYHLGQHRLAMGKVTAYEEDISIPFMVRGPGVPVGRTLPHLVLNNDLAPTFADLVGVPVPNFVDGRSVKPLLTDIPSALSTWRTGFLVEGWRLEPTIKAVPEIPHYQGFHSRDRVLVKYATGEHELYRLAKDPHQLRSQPRTNNENLYEKLSARLERLKDCASDACRMAEDGRSAPVGQQ